MGRVRPLVLVFSCVWLACGSAQAEKRVALVIGNSAYKSVPPLSNPANDAPWLAACSRRRGTEGRSAGCRPSDMINAGALPKSAPRSTAVIGSSLARRCRFLGTRVASSGRST